MIQVENLLTGLLMIFVCILNIVAISIIVVENKGTDVSESAIKTAQAGTGIALVVTGLYTAFMVWKWYYPRQSDNTLGIVLVGILMGVLCILNTVAIAIVTIQSDNSTTSIKIDDTAFSMALAGISITIATTFIYGAYNLATVNKVINEYRIQTGYLPNSGRTLGKLSGN